MSDRLSDALAPALLKVSGGANIRVRNMSEAQAAAKNLIVALTKEQASGMRNGLILNEVASKIDVPPSSEPWVFGVYEDDDTISAVGEGPTVGTALSALLTDVS